MLINKKINQKILSKRLDDMKDQLSVDYNMKSRMTYFDFTSGKTLHRYDTYVTHFGNYLIIKFYKEDTKILENLIILTKRSYVDKLNLDFLYDE